MRTTVKLEKDVLGGIETLRGEHGFGLSEAVNYLIRRGFLYRPPEERFVQETYDMGEAYVDVTNIGRALEEVEGPLHK